MMYTFELRPWLLVSDKMEAVGGLYCTGSTLPHVSVKDGCERYRGIKHGFLDSGARVCGLVDPP